MSTSEMHHIPQESGGNWSEMVSIPGQDRTRRSSVGEDRQEVPERHRQAGAGQSGGAVDRHVVSAEDRNQTEVSGGGVLESVPGAVKGELPGHVSGSNTDRGERVQLNPLNEVVDLTAARHDSLGRDSNCVGGLSEAGSGDELLLKVVLTGRDADQSDKSRKEAGEGKEYSGFNDVSCQEPEPARVPTETEREQISSSHDKDKEETVTSFARHESCHPHRQARQAVPPATTDTLPYWIRLRNTIKTTSEMQNNSKKQKPALEREDSFLKKFSTRTHQDLNNLPVSLEVDDESQLPVPYQPRPFVIHHDGTLMFYWLGLMTLAVLYNVWACIARQGFREIQQGCPPCWYTFDGLADLIYICDILIQFRTGYLDQGLMVYDTRKLYQKYLRSKSIYVDFACLLPLDLIQFSIGVQPMIRFPRFLKVYRTFRFVYMLESRTAYPNLFRVAHLTHLVLLGAHWFAAFYYMISEAEGFNNTWTYPKPEGEYSDISRKYLKSLYWATMTLTTIGDQNQPIHNNEYIFVTCSYLIGVFVFATIVGQVGNVINNRNASRIEFERLLDGAKIYMQTHNVPHNLQKRVQRWYDYVWSRGRLNGCDINSLGLLPDKLKTELAIHVNLETLRKVTIFQECQPEFLHDLVLKMKAYIFTPGDLICRRGEVAREMFIIADGVVEIISETGSVLKRMGAGDFFGEIGILNLDGGINRRSADVRSVGYLELFVLSREDVLDALKDHPDAESVIRNYGHKRLQEIEQHRQKAKPNVLEETFGSGSSANLPAANTFLQTLKSWNTVGRRQNNGHPLASTQAATPPGSLRCVVLKDSTQQASPNSKPPMSNFNTDASVSVLSVSKPELSTDFMTRRFGHNAIKSRMRLGYLRTAYATVRSAFTRRRARRRNVEVSDSPRRKSTENRLLLKSVDDQAVTVDLSTLTRSTCDVSVNIEELAGNVATLAETPMLQDKSSHGSNGRERYDRQSSNHVSGAKQGPGLTLSAPVARETFSPIFNLNFFKEIKSRRVFGSLPYTDEVEPTPVGSRDTSKNSPFRSKQPIILDVGNIHQLYRGDGNSEISANSSNPISSNNSYSSASFHDVLNQPKAKTTNFQRNTSIQESGVISEGLSGSYEQGNSSSNRSHQFSDKSSIKNHQIHLDNRIPLQTKSNVVSESSGLSHPSHNFTTSFSSETAHESRKVSPLKRQEDGCGKEEERGRVYTQQRTRSNYFPHSIISKESGATNRVYTSSTASPISMEGPALLGTYTNCSISSSPFSRLDAAAGDQLKLSELNEVACREHQSNVTVQGRSSRKQHVQFTIRSQGHHGDSWDVSCSSPTPDSGQDNGQHSSSPASSQSDSVFSDICGQR